ncbi:hypothetical protein EOM09_08935, partial [bacterium]|nr:hypothetical protein [bacterium]
MKKIYIKFGEPIDDEDHIYVYEGLLENDIVSIIDYPESREVLIGSVKSIVRNKKALGLTSILFDYSGEIEILFLMAEYNPKSKAIYNEVGRIEKTIPAKILFMT